MLPTPGAGASYCHRCDVLVGLDGVHVIAVERDDANGALTVTVESAPRLEGCPRCGVVAVSLGRPVVELIDAPMAGRPVRIRWRKRSWRCPEPACPTGAFTEQNPAIAAPRALLTTRAVDWAVGQLRRENASVQGIARQFGITWRTAWRAIKPVLARAAANESRFAGVSTLGVDEHIWHHVSVKDRGPKELTGMVDLTRDENGQVRARLLDLVPGRSTKAYANWLKSRGQDCRDRVNVATLDPFSGYKRAIDDELEDATAVLDAFHVIRLGTAAVDEVRRRVQQETLGHRGRKGDPLYGIRNILRAGIENLTDRQWNRLTRAITADERHEEAFIAFQCAQTLRAAYRCADPVVGRQAAEKILNTFHTCPIPEIARLGRTLRRWREAFLAYFTTDRATNGGTEAVNGLIELHRRIARGFRNYDNYRLRMLLIAGGLNPVTPT
ncbi:ISL3-like element ISAar39 family transposase [Georgenia halophila]|uniref:ISL3-like element ISAar39 family transposase n=1 Tax=Georgenia halophila TaxID=620889 RepID=A0ABP8LFE8_9MICO